MELALYCPVYGYYEKEADTAGRRGDYYTSVSVGSLFGELLAFQFAEWLQECGVRSAECGVGKAGYKGESLHSYKGPATAVLHLVEAGAHDGRLAADILRWLQKYRAELFERLEYWILEPSARRRALQRA